MYTSVFYLPLPALSIHSTLTSILNHLFLLLYHSALIEAFLHLSSPLTTHYLTHYSFCFYPFLSPGSRQSFLCPLVPSNTNVHSKRCCFLLHGLKEASEEHKCPLCSNALQALVAVAGCGHRGGCVHQILPFFLPTSLANCKLLLKVLK